MKRWLSPWLLLAPLLLVAGHSGFGGSLGPVGPVTPSSPAWRYTLLNGSYLLDDCLICGRPAVQEPMRGTFDLRVLETTPLYVRYSVENLRFTAGTTRTYTVTGSGEFKIGGEVASVQEMSLEAEIDDGTTKIPAELKSEAEPPVRAFPMMDITVKQTNGTLTQTYSLRLAAAPVRDLWFSTKTFFTAGTGIEAGKILIGGDLLSLSGHRVKTNADFYGSVGATPPGPDLGLDAVDILPGGEIAFSLDTGFPTSDVGPIYPGDLLSTKGRVIRRNQELLAPFGLMPVAPDTGLDAVHILDSGEILFSIESDIFSEKLGTMLRRGDLLSSEGKIVRTYEKLYENFHFLTPPTDNGLDVLYQWPGGEIWFSPEFGFTDDRLGPIGAGDLLSDQGYIVFRNAELTAAFAPVQATPDFGLDALFVITDITPPPPLPQLSLTKKSGASGVTLNWQGGGRVFQVERSTDLAEPFQPLSPVIPDSSWNDPADLARAFYRLRQW
ncbi:MAG TPA: hypothetical protein VG796_04020 [Verrucomicrobiales bacterium]|nr:hypothetical protein [Verrucomicrobiales bacterium]